MNDVYQDKFGTVNSTRKIHEINEKKLIFILIKNDVLIIGQMVNSRGHPKGEKYFNRIVELIFHL